MARRVRYIRQVEAENPWKEPSTPQAWDAEIRGNISPIRARLFYGA